MSNWSNNSRGVSGYSQRSGWSQNNSNPSIQSKGFQEKFEEQKRKQQIRNKYNENEERRKQIMADNLRRRREKEKKAKEEQQQKRRIEDEMLLKRKKDKEEAYLKYLRSNTTKITANQKQAPTLYDKYEAKKRIEQQFAEEPRGVSKWKSKNSQVNSNNKSEHGSGKKADDDQQLQALDLDIQATKDMERIKKFYQDGKKQLQLIESFAEEWDQEHGEKMLQSKLLDSLNLDGQALVNSKFMSRKGEQPLFEKEFKNMMASSVFIQDNKSNATNNKNVSKVNSRVKEPDQAELEDMIGYQSVGDQSDFWDKAFKKVPAPLPPKVPDIAQNNHKKQEKPILCFTKEQEKKASLMGWANNNIEEAQELFSNCTTNSDNNPSKRSFKRSQILKQMNEKLVKEKEKERSEVMQSRTQDISDSIPENIVIQESVNHKESKEQSRQVSNEKNKSGKVIRKTPEKIAAVNQPQKKVSAPLQEPPKISKPRTSEGPSRPVPVYEAKPQSSETRNRSQDKKQLPPAPYAPSTTAPNIAPPKPPSNTILKFKSRLSQQMPAKTQPIKPIPSTCTQDDMLDVDEYIKDDLMDINQKQRELQLEIKEFHINTKQKLREIHSKHEIKTGYLTTDQLLKGQEATQALRNNFTQEQLQLSLYRIDQLLIKKENALKQLDTRKIDSYKEQQKKSKNVSQQSEEILNYSLSENEQDTPQFNNKATNNNGYMKNMSLQSDDKKSGLSRESLINPLGNPDDLLKQVLSLAKVIANNKDIDLESLRDQLSKATHNQPQNKQQQSLEDSLELLDKRKNNFDNSQTSEKKKSLSPAVPHNLKENAQTFNKPPATGSYAQLRKRQQEEATKKPAPAVVSSPAEALGPPPKINKWKQRATSQSSNTNVSTRNTEQVAQKVPTSVVDEESIPMQTQQKINVNPRLKNLLLQ